MLVREAKWKSRKSLDVKVHEAFYTVSTLLANSSGDIDVNILTVYRATFPKIVKTQVLRSNLDFLLALCNAMR